MWRLGDVMRFMTRTCLYTEIRPGSCLRLLRAARMRLGCTHSAC
jgi:hypothetical protein